MGEDIADAVRVGGSHVRPIQLARILRGLTQSEVETAAGVPPTVLSKFERGERLPDPATRERLSMALDVPVDVLFPRS